MKAKRTLSLGEWTPGHASLPPSALWLLCSAGSHLPLLVNDWIVVTKHCGPFPCSFFPEGCVLPSVFSPKALKGEKANGETKMRRKFRKHALGLAGWKQTTEMKPKKEYPRATPKEPDVQPQAHIPSAHTVAGSSSMTLYKTHNVDLFSQLNFLYVIEMNLDLAFIKQQGTVTVP